MNQLAKYNAPTVAMAGAIMLFFWYLGGWSYPASWGPFQVFTLRLFVWMLLIGGGALLAVGGVCAFGLRVGLLLEVIVSGLCGLIMWLCAGTWLVSGAVGMNTILCGIFGLMYLSAARTAFQMYSSSARSARPAAMTRVPEAPAAPHPASLASSVLPKDGEPPPDEGYLAALAKEKD